jgi:hypothetical protein
MLGLSFAIRYFSSQNMLAQRLRYKFEVMLRNFSLRFILMQIFLYHQS